MTTRKLFIMILCVVTLPWARSQSNYWVQTNGPGSGYDVRSFASNSLGHLFAGTWTDGSIWKTTDNGATWTKCGGIPDPNPVLSLCNAPGDRMFACVFLRGVYVSTDDGATWKMKDSGLTDFTVRAAVLDDKQFLWVATESGLFRSTNSGDVWTLGRTGTFYNVFFDSAHAIVADDGSFIYRTPDHGDSWVTIPQTISGGLGGVHPDGSYYAATGSSAIYRSTDFGVSWVDMHSGVSWSGYMDAFTFNSLGDIYYSRDGYSTGMLYSNDHGATWTPLNSGLTTTRIIPLFHDPRGYIFVGTNGSGVFRSALRVDTVSSVAIDVQSLSYGFGNVRVGRRDTLSVKIFNRGGTDTLRITSITSTNERFVVSPQALLVAPRGSQLIQLVYAPPQAAQDTGAIKITSNDPQTPVLSLTVTGRSYALGHAPVISTISYVPNNSSEARIVWFRSVDDSLGAADQTTQYSVWRKVAGSGVPGSAVPSKIRRTFPAASNDALWDFIQAIPAIALDQYAVDVAIPYFGGGPLPWVTYMVVAQTRSMHDYASDPDSVQDPPALTGIGGDGAGSVPGDLVLRQNFPNPFNPSTTIQYGLPTRTNVSLVVYNALGQKITVLVDREEEAGYHEVRFDGTNVASGVYLARLKAGQYVRTSRLLLVR